MTHETLYSAAKLFVRRETSDLPAECKGERIMLTIEDQDIVALIVEFVKTHASIIKE
jgi:hypothetical protein